MAHGAGGKATQTLIEGLFAPAFASAALEELGDAGLVLARSAAKPGWPVMTTDTFVVKPLVFPGGSIGELAVNGTVNDLAVAGAVPVAITVALVLEEGLDADVLRAEVDAIASTAEAAGVEIVGGDTKVVERGLADGMYICTSGVAAVDPRASPVDRLGQARRPRAGLAARSASTAPRSCSPAASSASRRTSSPTPGRSGPPSTHCSKPRAPELRTIRDATRGGVATVLNELARASGVSVTVREADDPGAAAMWRAPASCSGSTRCTSPTRAMLVAFVAPDRPTRRSPRCASVPGCESAAELAEVRAEPPGMVLVETAFGGKRVMDLLAGDPLPRIC